VVICATKVALFLPKYATPPYVRRTPKADRRRTHVLERDFAFGARARQRDDPAGVVTRTLAWSDAGGDR
jgi:hypothetical protein